MISCDVSFVYDGCSLFHGYILQDWNSKLISNFRTFILHGVKDLMFGKMEGGRKKSQELKWKEGKGNESSLHSKCLVCKGERKGGKKKILML